MCHLKIAVIDKLLWYKRSETLQDMLLLESNQLPVVEYIPIKPRPKVFYSLHVLVSIKYWGYILGIMFNLYFGPTWVWLDY